jgi:kynureninase
MTQFTSRAHALQLDAADPLASFRERFVHADPDLIYLDGNSLGKLPKATAALAEDAVRRQWGDRLIRGWNEGWFTLPERIGAKIAQLIGASGDEVIMADSTTINLLKLVIAALRHQRGRVRVVTDDMNFPSDMYALQGAIDLLGQQHRLDVIASDDGIHGPEDALVAALDEDVALVALSHTAFKSGYVYDMGRITEAAHAAGALVVWDLSHSVASVPVALGAANADMAIGCSYKYVNGGPGAPAFMFVRRDLQGKLRNPLAGWMGQRDLFEFGMQYQPADGMRGFLTGTPMVLSLALIEPGVDLLLEAGMDALRAKSVAQSEYLIGLWEQQLAPLGFTLKSPRDAAKRGSHVSFGHQHGLGIDLAMINDRKLLPDFRPPDNIRIGIAPLYTSFADIFDAVQGMREIVASKLYEKYADAAPVVT